MWSGTTSSQSIFIPNKLYYLCMKNHQRQIKICSRTAATAGAAAAKSLQSCLTLCDPIDISPPGSPISRILQDSPGKNTGVGCHFLLHCMKVKIESEVTQSCPTLSDPMDCSLPGSSVHGIFQARVLEWVAIAFSCSRTEMHWISNCKLIVKYIVVLKPDCIKLFYLF